MTNPTLAELLTKIKEPLDLEEETFIDPAELVGFVNDAIDEAEKAVQDVDPDYFLMDEYLNVQEGCSDFDPPVDIYANKIRTIVYNDGGTKYEVKRWRGKLADLELIEGNEDYQYMLVNKLEGYKIRLLPESRETSQDHFRVWFIRNANRLAVATDICDIPEATKFIVSKAQGLCMAKENGGIIPAAKQAEIDREKMEMIEALADRVPDEDNKITMDIDPYAEHQ